MKHSEYSAEHFNLLERLNAELKAALAAHGGTYRFERENAPSAVIGGKEHFIIGIAYDKKRGFSLTMTEGPDPNGKEISCIPSEVLPDMGSHEIYLLLDGYTIETIIELIEATAEVSDVTVLPGDYIDPEILMELTALCYKDLYRALENGSQVSILLRSRAAKITALAQHTDWNMEDFWLALEAEAEALLAEAAASLNAIDEYHEDKDTTFSDRLMNAFLQYKRLRTRVPWERLEGSVPKGMTLTESLRDWCRQQTDAPVGDNLVRLLLGDRQMQKAA